MKDASGFDGYEFDDNSDDNDDDVYNPICCDQTSCP
jgi:hypothetical protein